MPKKHRGRFEIDASPTYKFTANKILLTNKPIKKLQCGDIEIFALAEALKNNSLIVEHSPLRYLQPEVHAPSVSNESLGIKMNNRKYVFEGSTTDKCDL